LVEQARDELAAVHAAREVGLPACRRAIRSASSAIRAIHRRDHARRVTALAESEAALREAQGVLWSHPSVAFAGFLQDAEKEYAEAMLAAALIDGGPLPDHSDVGVGLPAWLNGLAEAASELRRHLLDRLRTGETEVAETLLGLMEDAYDALVLVDYPDAVTGGLRRSTDALRAVLERTRSDVTTTVMQLRLQSALERRWSDESGPGSALP
jgi:translin